MAAIFLYILWCHCHYVTRDGIARLYDSQCLACETERPANSNGGRGAGFLSLSRLGDYLPGLFGLTG
jgi:hypothetical protein